MSREPYRNEKSIGAFRISESFAKELLNDVEEVKNKEVGMGDIDRLVAFWKEHDAYVSRISSDLELGSS